MACAEAGRALFDAGIDNGDDGLINVIDMDLEEREIVFKKSPETYRVVWPNAPEPGHELIGKYQVTVSPSKLVVKQLLYCDLIGESKCQHIRDPLTVQSPLVGLLSIPPLPLNLPFFWSPDGGEKYARQRYVFNA